MPRAQRCQVIPGSWQGGAISLRWDSGKEQLFYTRPGDEKAECILPPGKHTLQITVYGHRRNSFGPFYCTERPFWVGPYEFSVTQEKEKVFVKLGLLGTVQMFALSTGEA